MTSENNKSDMNEMINEIDKSMEKINRGDILKGSVISVNENEVLVNISYISDGIITKSEISDEEIDINDMVKVGDEIDVYVLKVNDGEGNVLLSKKRADKIKTWDYLVKVQNDDETIEVEIKEVVKGGVITYIKGLRGFIPASHVSASYVEDLNKLIGNKIEVKVIELEKEKNKLVLSRKVVEKEELEIMKEKLFDTLKKGEKREGVVKRLTKFGAFVDLGGVDGLIRNQDLSWQRVKHASEVVKEGDKVEVYVLDFNKKDGRIALGLKDKAENPWNNITEEFKLDSIVEGKIVRLLDFGAFVEIKPGIEGLVHISQISEDRIAKPSDVLKVGDKVKVKVLDIKEDSQRISLSIKEAKDTFVGDYKQFNDEDEPVTIGDLFKDKLKDLKF